MTELARATLPFLTFLENLRAPWLEKVFLVLTRFGSEMAMIAVVVLLLWCVDKRRGYYALFVCLFGTVISQVLKMLCMIPRPWMLDPEKVHPAQGALSDARDYSFPSGHAQNAVGLYGAVAATSRRKGVRVACVCLMVLVPLSRMVLGVHTPLDIAFGAFMSALLLALFWFWYRSGDDRSTSILLGAGAVFCFAAVLFVSVYRWGDAADQTLLEEGRSNLWAMAGAMSGLWIAHEVDRRHTHYPTQAVWYGQIVKLVVGMALIFGLRTVLKPILGTSGPMTALRYFLMIGLVTTFWPMTFSSLSKLGKKGEK